MSTLFRFATMIVMVFGLATGVIAQDEDAAKKKVEKKIEKKAAKKLNGKIEKSIAAGLRWLAAQQHPNGAWDFAQLVDKQSGAGELVGVNNAATGMALLCFAKAGQTHATGEYKEVVAKGAKFLVGNMKDDGSFLEPRGSMYSHGLATQALITLYSLTDDKYLQKPAQSALNFIAYAQDPVGGGWRYMPKQAGDTSVSCWQLQALVLGHSAKLDVDKETMDGVTKFLDAVQSQDGAFYGYTTSGMGQATSAQGLLCRIHLGWKAGDERVKQGVATLSKRGPSKSNWYYNLFATQLMKEHGGKAWKNWRTDLAQQLIAKQCDGDAIAGSWFAGGDHGVNRGGRLYCTAMATMALETLLEVKKKRK